MEKPALLLTGKPSVGKTTLVRAIIHQLADDAGGFYTRELRVDGSRIGFEIVSLLGDSSVLATKSSEPQFARETKFGDYRINLDAVEITAVTAMEQAVSTKKLVIIDEIGPMEIVSPRFQSTVMRIINDVRVLVFGTIVERPYEFADDVKKSKRVTLLEVTVSNRNSLPDLIVQVLRSHI